jgi:long-chain acyl-CoA synthetase
MSEVKAQGSSARPWLSGYSPYMPAELDAPRWRNGVELFEDGFNVRPAAPAIYYFDTVISHREEHEQAMAFAVALREELGLAPGDRLALMLQNIPQSVIAVHGAWLAGITTTSVNVMNKRKELGYQLRDCEAKAIVCLESLYGLVSQVVPETSVEHIVTASELDYLDHVPDLLASSVRLECSGAVSFAGLLERHQGRELEPAAPGPDDPAALSYTSGTTGPPKGAINTHRNIVYNAEVFARWYQIEENDVTIGLSPMFHITGLLSQLCVSRASGGPIILGYRFDAAELLRLIAKWRGSWAVGPLTAYIALLQHPDFESTDLSSLTKVASGGAPVYPAVVRQWEEAAGVYIHNTYGLTEVTGPFTLVPFGGRAPVDPESGGLAVGLPISGFDCKVVDMATGEPVATGETGEILISGPAVVAGYWNKAEETAHAVRDGWLHTGDVGKMDADGWIYLVDRAKDMIIVSGYKVWPMDVETTLHEHPAVLEACVVGVPDSYRGEKVKGFVTLRAGASVEPEELIAHCRELMAVYKCPREVEIVDELPKTASGKLLRRELRDRAAAVSAGS